MPYNVYGKMCILYAVICTERIRTDLHLKFEKVTISAKKLAFPFRLWYSALYDCSAGGGI